MTPGDEAASVAMHDGQLEVTLDVVAALVADQFPEWAGLPLSEVRSAGTVNAVFRLGDRLAARFPLQDEDPAEAGRRLARETAASSELVGRTRFPVPEPVAIGHPGTGYPLPWAVQSWLPGTTAIEADASASSSFALDVAAFIVDVRSLPTGGRGFHGTGRGGDLTRHDEWVQECLHRSTGLLDTLAAGALWRSLRRLPRPSEDVMSHGDLMPGNVLVAEGRLTGVLDTGGAGPADPSLDLVGAWHLLESGPRTDLRTALSCDDVTWGRGAAWALEQALGLGWYYRDSNPTMSGIGLRTVDRLLAAQELAT